MGSVVLFWNDLIDIDGYNETVLLGRGSEAVRYADENNDTRETNYGVSYRGGITGIVFLFFELGIIGVFLFCIYFIPILCRVRNIRMRWVVIGTVLFDFIFYNGQIIDMFMMQSMLFFIVVMLSFKSKLYTKY